ncbi:MAG: DUF255 domain-containing protein [Planctomycetaceae bacterium]|jgi:YHS domain-containing protein|nr:DUF255 domain-containing protein [Planctomycetaceae bacterium]
MNTSSLNCRFGSFSPFATVVAVCLLTVSGLAQVYAPMAPPSSVRWESDLDAAMNRAEREQRPLFLHFVANDSQPAQQMAVEVFTQPNIVARLNANFVMVRINTSEAPALVQKFAVTSIPSDIILKPNGQLIYRRTGSIPAERFSNYLDFLQQTIQPERGSVPPPPAVPPIAAGFAAPRNLSAPQQEVDSISGVVNDPFSQQPSVYQQSPNGQPLGMVAGTMPPPSMNIHPMRVEGKITAEPRTHSEYRTPSPQVPTGGFALPAAAAAFSSITAAMAELPAPEKMTVEVPLALEGFCPVTLSTEERWVSGNPAYCTMYQGHIFRFATPEAVAAFARNPANYVPIALGEDIVQMVDRNKRVNGNRNFGVCYHGRVFLFSSQESLSAFSERPDFYAEIALKYETARKDLSVPLVY